MVVLEYLRGYLTELRQFETVFLDRGKTRYSTMRWKERLSQTKDIDLRSNSFRT